MTKKDFINCANAMIGVYPLFAHNDKLFWQMIDGLAAELKEKYPNFNRETFRAYIATRI